MSNCFWDPESVVGLSKVCTAAAPVGDVLSFVPVIVGGYYMPYDPGTALIAHVAGYPYDPRVVCTPEFTGALESAAYTGSVTGITVGINGDNYPEVNFPVLRDPLPPGTVFLPSSGSFGEAFGDVTASPSGSWNAGHLYYVRVEVGGQTFYGMCIPGAGV